MKHLRIGPIDYDLIEQEIFGTRVGEFDETACRIKIAKGLQEQSRNVTILHECIHAILYQAGIEHPDSLPEVLANGFYGLIRDNPLFFQNMLSRKVKK